MKIGIICGSHRDPSESGKVARCIEKSLLQQGHCDETWLYDLGGNPLPLWDEGVWDGDDTRWQETLRPLSDQLLACDGFVVVSPEWHGMAPAGLEKFFPDVDGRRRASPQTRPYCHGFNRRWGVFSGGGATHEQLQE